MCLLLLERKTTDLKYVSHTEPANYISESIGYVYHSFNNCVEHYAKWHVEEHTKPIS